MPSALTIAIIAMTISGADEGWRLAWLGLAVFALGAHLWLAFAYSQSANKETESAKRDGKRDE